ncbi:MAG: hypothetical protein BGP24_17940 [Lysobacterales bacterium 69-70]|nr:hypothetical protein [Xanthomonadaceae bacterium]ODU32662.1 MAG: hypothetical protein ABS97_15100 [Xanthomonadaceae bacterium SCN 69-320]ODV19173.1 MAG: hypothetical protein ABT27_11615 [Xanthomonadaceae bacterium SCN 69-25]OJY99654.1 MAG: hypothetical protein BGP24_17940 [Xanthomonadales bacterium 69-70]
MNAHAALDAAELLRRVAERISPALRAHVVVVGSIAAAWAFRDVSGAHAVATKDIDLLLRPAVDALATATSLGRIWLDEGWQPQFTHGRRPGDDATPDDELPALRLQPPGERTGWFVELLGEASPDQVTRKHWRRFATGLGAFALPSFRYLRVAVHEPDDTEFGLRVARPARMALAHLLEHAEPDTTPIAGLPGQPARFVKDLGRAVVLWWLARQQSPLADRQWLAEWRETLAALYPDDIAVLKVSAARGVANLADHLRAAHAIALNSLLAAHGTTLPAYQRAYTGLCELVDRL